MGLRNTLTVTLPIGERDGQGRSQRSKPYLQEKLRVYMRPKCHTLLLDESINGRRGVAFNVFQMFLVGAMKLCAHAEEVAALRSAQTAKDAWAAMVSAPQNSCLGSGAGSGSALHEAAGGGGDDKKGNADGVRTATKRRRIHRSVAALAKRSRPKFILDCASDVTRYTLELVKRRCEAMHAQCWLLDREDAVLWLCLRAFERTLGNGRGNDLEYTDVANGALSMLVAKREELERRWTRCGPEAKSQVERTLRSAASDERNAGLLGSVWY